MAVAELARSGFRPTGDLWFIAVADEEDGIADVGMRWLLEERTDIRPTHSINEGGGERLPLADGRAVVMYAVGEKGTLPFQITALGEAGHASQPTLGNNAVPMQARLLTRLGNGLADPVSTPVVRALLRAVLGREEPDLGRAVAEAGALHRTLVHVLPALMGPTLAPTMLWGSDKRNVMPARATAEVDCRTSRRSSGRCSATTSPTSSPGPSRSPRRRARRSTAPCREPSPPSWQRRATRPR